jgi:hypothetical protein
MQSMAACACSKAGIAAAKLFSASSLSLLASEAAILVFSSSISAASFSSLAMEDSFYTVSIKAFVSCFFCSTSIIFTFNCSYNP